MSHQIDSRLKELEIELPKPATPVASYVGFRVTGNTVYVAGQAPSIDDRLVVVGKVGGEVTLERAQYAARLCGLNILSQLKEACAGNLDRVRKVVRLGGFVNSAGDFGQQPQVINGASELFLQVFGKEKGSHARTAISAGGLPANVSVEIDAIFEIE